jgi:glycerol-3-phosphate cytidylyltransferase-like family protein
MAKDQKEAIKRVNGMIDEINRQTEQHRQLRQLRNLTRQLRVEAPTSFVTLRDSKLPILAKEQSNSLLEGYKYVSELTEEERKKYGAEIFEHIINYLRLLAVKSLFPRGELKEMTVVKIGAKLESV